MTRRLLIVSSVFPPLVAGGAQRMYQFAKLLPEHGWDTTVLTGKQPASIALDAPAIAALSDHTAIITSWSPASVVVTRGRAAPRQGPRALVRHALRNVMKTVLFPDREVLWVPGAVVAGTRALRERPHHAVLATYSPATNLIIGWALARAFRLPLIVDFRDLWATIQVAGAFISPLHRAAAMKLEGTVVRAASRLTAVAPKMASHLAAAHGLANHDATSITNGFDPADVALAVDTRDSAPGPFRLVYSGSVHSDYNLEPFWRAMRAVVDRKQLRPDQLRIEFVGNLALDDVRRIGLEDYVDTHPFVAHERVFDALGRADALLVVETPGYYAEFGYAAKVFDYLLTGKPVLALVEIGGNTHRLLEASRVGYCAEAHDQAALEQKIEAVLAQHGAKPRAVDVSASPLRDFNRELLVEKLGAVLDDMVAAEPHGRW